LVLVPDDLDLGAGHRFVVISQDNAGHAAPAAAGLAVDIGCTGKSKYQYNHG
jgi:hypothetical protein